MAAQMSPVPGVNSYLQYQFFCLIQFKFNPVEYSGVDVHVKLLNLDIDSIIR